MASPRPVRIVRVPARAATDPIHPTRTARDAEFRPNVGGRARGSRLFAGFLGILVVIYLAFAALALSATTPGARENPVTWGLFTAVAAALAVWGWTLTLGRVPRAARVAAGHLLVEERPGRVRRFDLSAGDRRVVLQHYGEGFLSPRPTELVELRGPEGRRTYLVEAGLLEGGADAPGA